MKSREFGTVATHNRSYAFIRPDAAVRDVFAHVSELPEGQIHRGVRVSLETVRDKFKMTRKKKLDSANHSKLTTSPERLSIIMVNLLRILD